MGCVASRDGGLVAGEPVAHGGRKHRPANARRTFGSFALDGRRDVALVERSERMRRVRAGRQMEDDGQRSGDGNGLAIAQEGAESAGVDPGLSGGEERWRASECSLLLDQAVGSDDDGAFDGAGEAGSESKSRVDGLVAASAVGESFLRGDLDWLKCSRGR